MKGAYESQTAVFAAGCFWGVQYYFDQVPGVVETIVGYTGGSTDNPTYEDVCYNDTHHAEAVKITFDPTQVSFETLLKQFFRMHDPTQLNRQGPDVGEQYRSAIFPQNDEQRQQAEAIVENIKHETGKAIFTSIEEPGKFWPAEDYHQKYTEKNRPRHVPCALCGCVARVVQPAPV